MFRNEVNSMKYIRVAGKQQATTNGKGNMSAFMYKSKRKGGKKK